MAIEIFYSNSFLKSARKLPKNIQEQLVAKMSLLNQNPFSKSLHTKPLSGKLAGFFSFRITRDWRVVFQFIDPGLIKLIHVAHRKDIYK